MLKSAFQGLIAYREWDRSTWAFLTLLSAAMAALHQFPDVGDTDLPFNPYWIYVRNAVFFLLAAAGALSIHISLAKRFPSGVALKSLLVFFSSFVYLMIAGIGADLLDLDDDENINRNVHRCRKANTQADVDSCVRFAKRKDAMAQLPERYQKEIRDRLAQSRSVSSQSGRLLPITPAHLTGSSYTVGPSRGLPPMAVDFAEAVELAKKHAEAHPGKVAIQGRIVIDAGAPGGKLTDVDASFPFLADGSFAFATVGRTHAMRFGLHLQGYESVELSLGDLVPGQDGTVHLPEIHLKPLLEGRQANLKGRLVMKERSKLRDARLVLSLLGSGRPAAYAAYRTAEKATGRLKQLEIGANGEFSAAGLTPGRYLLAASAPGHAATREMFELKPAEHRDFAAVRLDPPKTVVLEYQTSPSGAGDWTAARTVNLLPDDRFRAHGPHWDEPSSKWGANYGDTFEIRQHEGEIYTHSTYAPAIITDLGAGSLDDRRPASAGNEIVRFNDPRSKEPLQVGHVYRMHHQHFNYWMLFRVVSVK